MHFHNGCHDDSTSTINTDTASPSYMSSLPAVSTIKQHFQYEICSRFYGKVNENFKSHLMKQHKALHLQHFQSTTKHVWFSAMTVARVTSLAVILHDWLSQCLSNVSSKATQELLHRMNVITQSAHSITFSSKWLIQMSTESTQCTNALVGTDTAASVISVMSTGTGRKLRAYR